MSSCFRTLAAALAAFSILAAGAETLADSKKECAMAYEKVQSFREQGKLLDARKQAVACSAPTCSVYVTRDCVQWLAEIEASLPTVVLTARDAAGADTPAVRVLVDGQVVAEKLDGKAVPLNPGEHVVRFTMEGVAAIEQKVLIQQGEKNRAISASFQKVSAVEPPAPAAPAPSAAPEPEPRGGGAPVWAWVSGAGGLALIGVGAGFGVAGLQAQSKLVTACGGNPALCPVVTSAVTVPLANQRTLDRNVVLGVGAAGVVAIGAAVVGIVRGSGTKRVARSSMVVVPLGEPSGGGVAMSGSF